MRLSLPLRRFVASLLFVVYATFTVLGSALVKCQEADGTASIEWRSAGCCVPKPLANSGLAVATAASSEQGEDCGGCDDQSLADTLSATTAHGSVAAPVKAPDVSALPATLLVVTSPVVSAAPERRARQMRAPHPPPCLAAIRSVVILV